MATKAATKKHLENQEVEERQQLPDYTEFMALRKKLPGQVAERQEITESLKDFESRKKLLSTSILEIMKTIKFKSVACNGWRVTRKQNTTALVTDNDKVKEYLLHHGVKAELLKKAFDQATTGGEPGEEYIMVTALKESLE